MDKTKLTYEVMPADIDELVFDNLPVDERVVALARKSVKLLLKRV